MSNSTNSIGASEYAYDSFLAEWRDESSFVLCHTSGSTGKPKQITIPKRQMRHSARRTMEFFGLGAGSLLYSCISPQFVGGKMMAVRAETYGARLAYEKPSNHPLDGYEGEPIDLLSVVPSQMLHILEHPELWKYLRHILIGGAPLPDSLRRRIYDAGLDAWESYGMTETASHIALRKVDPEEKWFCALGDISVCLDGDGCLQIEMPGWQRLKTNDIAEVKDSRTFRILGRKDNVIITAGKKVHPEMVEQVLQDALGCPVMLTSVPHEKWGQMVVLLVEDGNDSGDTAEADSNINRICRERLAPECRPKLVHHAALPRTLNGKLERKPLIL